MSRGLGRIEREIIAIFKSRAAYHRDTEAFDAWHLADSIYADAGRTQRLTVLRAMHSLARKFPRRYALTGGKGTTPLYLCRVEPTDVPKKERSAQDRECVTKCASG